jgi:hypothetical protein
VPNSPVGPQKKVVVGKAASFEIGQGLLFPSVIEPIESADKHRVVFRLLPTHGGAEESVRACLELARVRDIRFTKGMLSFWKFVTDSGGESSVDS